MADAAAVQQVIQALNVLYQDPDTLAKEKANAWLSDFQKSNEAWSTAQLILFAPDAPVEGKLFAAQTFRTKITYDLDQLPQAHRVPLRDSLLTALRTFSSGPRVILTQICIALADLALQLSSSEWSDPTTSMIEQYGKEPSMAGALLEFLQVLAEEYATNLKLEVRNDFGRGAKGDSAGKEVARGEQADQVIQLLSMYVQASGITPALQNQCFACLGAWLRTGQAAAVSLAGTPILAAAFSALSSDELFDNAVDVLVDIIHETQELEDNMELVKELVPRLIALKPALALEATREDEDKMRGYCRVLVEAGEWYAPLMVQHPDSFLPLVEAIADCATYDHLEVVGITLNFWYKLARGVRHARENPATRPLLDIFANLVGTIIRHLHYPADDTSLVGQERDDFRNFRHTIGDTLKDCCGVLGATACLRRSYEIISEALAAPGEASWQDLEAPLFSMRSMGAEVDPGDNEIMPLIMDLIPKLPQHPKIRYAAILVIGRYTEWINYHPEHIQFQLPYVSSGFDDPDVEVSAAAAQTMKYLCKDCSHHLVPFVPQLHSFVQTISPKLPHLDLLDLSAAIAHIIIVMDPAEAPAALSSFAMPNIEIVHAVASKPTPATPDELRAACDALQRVDVYLAIVERFEAGLPAECEQTCQQVWSVLDVLLAKYGADSNVAEKACVAIRRGLHFFGDAAATVAPSVLDRLATAFVGAQKPASSYLWITGKMVGMFAHAGDPTFEGMLRSAFERESEKVISVLQRTQPAMFADVLDDYAHLLCDVIEHCPSLLFLSPVFPSALQSTLSTLTLMSPQIVLTALDVIRAVIGHESLQHDPATDRDTSPFVAQYPLYAAAIRSAMDTVSFQLVGILLDVLVGGYEDTSSNVLTVFRLLSMQFSAQLAAAIPAALEAMPIKVASLAEKEEFLVKFNTAIAAQNPNHIKESFTWLLRTTKRSQARARALDERRQ